MEKKIISLIEAAKLCTELKKNKQKVILSHGAFDLVHLGHLKHFESAKKLGNILIVSITADKFIYKGPGRQKFNQDQRMEFLAKLEMIDYVVLSNEITAVSVIKKIKPSIFCKGPDYKNDSDDVTGNIKKEKLAIKNVKGKIEYTNDQIFSSSKLINESNNKKNHYLENFRKLIDVDDTLNKLDLLKKKKVLILGEVIIDEYHFCEAIGKSGKEPVMVLKDIKTEKYLGGVLSIARNVATFCKKVNVVSVLGENNGYKEFIKKNIEKNVIFDFISKKNSPTIIKKRYVDNISKNKILGVYKLNDKQIEKNEENKILNLLKNIKKRFDLIIVSDFGHGMMTKKVIKALTKKGVFVAANSQLNSSNKGYHDLNKYSGVDCIVINESELRYELRDRDNSIESLMKKVKKKLKIKNLIVTKGSAGAVMLDKKEKLFYAEAFAKKVIDKVGSGDTLMAITSLFLQKKIDPNLALLAGSLAAANSVENIGNKPIKKIDIIKSLEYLLK